MSAAATILHADLDSFYASVEQRDDPALRARPVAVGGGVILAASYEAKAHGVRTAMGGRRAQRLCPGLIVVPPRFSAYSAASRAVFEIFRETAPDVEGISIDEAFLDVRGLEHISGTPVEIATRLRNTVREHVGLPITVGVARTKFLAKVASGVAKPDGLLVVDPEHELEFLHPLPVERLWGVGAVTGGKLRRYGVTTVGQVAGLEESLLVELVGRGVGRKLHALARGRDPRRVRSGVRRRSVGAQRALGSRPRPWSEVTVSLEGLVDRVTRRMRAARRMGRTVVLRLRFADYTRATRSHTMPQATARTATILRTALGLLEGERDLVAARGLTLVGVAVTNLCDVDAVQLALPFDRTAGLDAAVDSVLDRFGSAALRRGVQIGRELGEAIPMLPD
jgi:DNA polymerase-4